MLGITNLTQMWKDFFTCPSRRCTVQQPQLKFTSTSVMVCDWGNSCIQKYANAMISLRTYLISQTKFPSSCSNKCYDNLLLFVHIISIKIHCYFQHAITYWTLMCRSWMWQSVFTCFLAYNIDCQVTKIIFLSSWHQWRKRWKREIHVHRLLRREHPHI